MRTPRNHAHPPLPRRRPPSRRAGFSLIELLINLAIIAALAGIAAPLYSDYIYSTQSTKAQYDLDLFRSAIVRYEQKEGLFAGGSLTPLVGRTLLELSVDPWGNDYFVDANLGVVGSFGADGTIFGEDQDEDIAIHFNPYLIPLRAWYHGGFGIPKNGNRLELKTRKVFGLVSGMESQAPDDVVLVPDPAEPLVPFSQLGFQIDLLNTRPSKGLLSLVCCKSPNPNDVTRIPVRAGDLVNFSPLVLSITEIPSPESPLYEAPDDYVLGTKPAETTDGGIRLDKGF